MSKRLVMTYMSWIWEGEDEEPIEDMGYWEDRWGKWSDYKDDDTLWDDAEIEDRRNASMVDLELDEYDEETQAVKVVDWLTDQGLLYEYGSGWFQGEPFTYSYQTGETLELAAHFVEEDWTPEEITEIYEEIDFRVMEEKARRQENIDYWNSVKAVV